MAFTMGGCWSSLSRSSMPDIKDGVASVPEDCFEKLFERIGASSERAAIFAKFTLQLILTCLALFDVISDWLQTANYYRNYGGLTDEELESKVQYYCTRNSSVVNPLTERGQNLDVAKRRTTNTIYAYFFAAACGTLIQAVRLFLLWTEKERLPHCLLWCKSSECPDNCYWPAVTRLARTSHVKEVSIVEVLLLQLSLVLEDFPMTIANYNLTVDSCRSENSDTILLIAAAGSMLSAFYVLWVYSLHLFFIMFPHCCGCIDDESWTLAMKVCYYPWIVLFMTLCFSTMGGIWMAAMGLCCAIRCEWCRVICFCPCCSPRRNTYNPKTGEGGDGPKYLPDFLRAAVLVISIIVFVLNTLLFYYAYFGNPFNPEVGYAPDKK